MKNIQQQQSRKVMRVEKLPTNIQNKLQISFGPKAKSEVA